MELLRLTHKSTNKKRFYTVKEAVDTINRELGLKSKEIIIPERLRYWLKEGIIPEGHRMKGSSTSITAEELNEIKEISFFHIVLGVKLGKIQFAREFINTLKIEWIIKSRSK